VLRHDCWDHNMWQQVANLSEAHGGH